MGSTGSRQPCEEGEGEDVKIPEKEAKLVTETLTAVALEAVISLLGRIWWAATFRRASVAFCLREKGGGVGGERERRISRHSLGQLLNEQALSGHCTNLLPVERVDVCRTPSYRGI